MLVRYDGWFLAAVICVSAAIVLWRLRPFAPQLRRGLVNFLLFTCSTAALFLLYNQIAFNNALEFANGPYSARAIQERARRLEILDRRAQARRQPPVLGLEAERR